MVELEQELERRKRCQYQAEFFPLSDLVQLCFGLALVLIHDDHSLWGLMALTVAMSCHCHGLIHLQMWTLG